MAHSGLNVLYLLKDLDSRYYVDLHTNKGSIISNSVTLSSI